MTVRRAEKKDTPRIQQLLWQVEQVHHRIRPDLFRDGGRKYTDAQLADILADDARPVLAAVDENDRLLGYAFCKFEEYRDDNIMQDRRTLYLDDLCVDETLRGQHIGRALFEAVRDYARAHGCRDPTLNVWTGNDAARRFYESCGFRPRKVCMDYEL